MIFSDQSDKRFKCVDMWKTLYRRPKSSRLPTGAPCQKILECHKP